VGDVRVRALGRVVGDALDAPSPRREAHHACTAVGRVGNALHVAGALEVPEEVVHRLLRHLHLVRSSVGRKPSRVPPEPATAAT
jgi:hypothetical protein